MREDNSAGESRRNSGPNGGIPTGNESDITRYGAQPEVAVLLPDLRVGGAERAMVNLVNALAARGTSVDLVVLYASGEFLSHVSAKVHLVDLKSGRIRNGYIPLVKYLRQRRPRTLVANMWPVTVLAVLARVLSRVDTRVFVVEHTTWSLAEICANVRTRWLAKTSMFLAFPRADGIICVSEGAAADLVRFARLNRARVSVINNPIVDSSAKYHPAPEQPRDWCGDGHKRIIAVGSLKPVKDYPTLLNAFALLTHTVNAKLLILGEGPERHALEERVAAMGLSRQVFMPGVVHDPLPYLEHAHLHVLSSVAEGLPSVIIEAMSVGTPVVSTDCPHGPRELLGNGRLGTLVSVQNAQCLADGMKAELASPHGPAELMERAREFAIDKIVDQYEALLYGGYREREN